jgi:hypothetical protein
MYTVHSYFDIDCVYDVDLGSLITLYTLYIATNRHFYKTILTYTQCLINMG